MFPSVVTHIINLIILKKKWQYIKNLAKKEEKKNTHPKS